MGRWTNFAVLVVILIIAVGVYFLYIKPVIEAAPEPELVKGEFSSVLAGAGVTINDLNDTIGSFYLHLDEEAVQSLKEGISGLPKGSSDSLKFSELMQGITALDEKQGKISREFEDMLELTMTEFCTNIDYWQAKGDESSDLVIEAIELEESLDAFYKSNPDYASLNIHIDTENLADQQENLIHALNRLVDMCVIAVYSIEEEESPEGGSEE